MTNIKSVKVVGKCQTYDLEVNHQDHQYYLSNGMLTSNSHATLYSMISFHTAYLKANYTIEFLVANLISEVRSNAKSAKDNIIKIKNEIRSKNVKIVPPDVNKSQLSWKIINDNTLMTGLDSLKYMGKDAIPELIAKRPFKSYQDLIFRTDASKVRSPSIQAMAASGSLDDFKLSGLDRKVMFHYASDYRAKMRSHMDKLLKVWEKEHISLGWEEFQDQWKSPDGQLYNSLPSIPEARLLQHLESFKYAFPKEVPWSVQELFALEEYYMGEGISGDTFERYPKFFDNKKTVPFSAIRKLFPWRKLDEDERSNRKANTHHLGNQMRPLEAVITSVFSFVVKKEDSKIFGQEMARLTIQDPWGDEATLLCFPEAWEGMKTRIKKELSGGTQDIVAGVAIKFIASFQWESENINSFILSDILEYKSPPSVPKDLSSKKIKMPRSKKITSEQIELFEKEELLEVLENEVLDDGMLMIDNDDD